VNFFGFTFFLSKSRGILTGWRSRWSIKLPLLTGESRKNGYLMPVDVIHDVFSLSLPSTRTSIGKEYHL
jgi:hypothetical protein